MPQMHIHTGSRLQQLLALDLRLIDRPLHRRTAGRCDVSSGSFTESATVTPEFHEPHLIDQRGHINFALRSTPGRGSLTHHLRVNDVSLSTFEIRLRRVAVDIFYLTFGICGLRRRRQVLDMAESGHELNVGTASTLALVLAP